MRLYLKGLLARSSVSDSPEAEIAKRTCSSPSNLVCYLNEGRRKDGISGGSDTNESEGLEVMSGSLRRLLASCTGKAGCKSRITQSYAGVTQSRSILIRSLSSNSLGFKTLDPHGMKQRLLATLFQKIAELHKAHVPFFLPNLFPGQYLVDPAQYEGSAAGIEFRCYDRSSASPQARQAQATRPRYARCNPSNRNSQSRR